MAKPTGRPRGRPANKLKCDPADLPRICLGKTSKQIMAETGLSQHISEKLAAYSKMNADEFAEAQRGQLQPILARLADKIAAELDTMKPAQAAIVYGIFADKLASQPKVLNQALHLHIKGDAGSALQAILGPAAQSVFAGQRPKDSKAPNYLAHPKPGPIIDAEATESS